jgi:microcystin-dependent protein
MNGTSVGTIVYDPSTQNLKLNSNQFLPTGSLSLYAGTAAPPGWILCQGQTLDISSYSNLFSVIGVTYGGNGVNNFALPDLRGRVPVGSGQLNGSGTNYSQGTLGGVENHSLTVGEMPSHTHIGTINTVGDHTHSYQDAYFAENRSMSGNNNYGTAASSDYDNNFIYRTQSGSWSADPNTFISTGSAGSHTHTMTNSNTGGGSSFSIVQPYVVMSYIIKY